MKIRKYILYLGTILATLLVSCGESLEDTYSDYAGDGKIRYIGKCSNLTISSGWHRLQVQWVNSTDVIIDKIKVSWEASGVKRDSLLDKTVSSCDITNLADDTYRIDVCALDKDGNESLIVSNYGRPYTYNHEAVRSFTRVITKHYKINNRLIFYMDNWNDSIVEAKLHYTHTSGEERIYELSKEIAAQGLIGIPEVDIKEPIFITRNGKLEGCNDLIQFANYELDSERIYSADFKMAIERRYGFNTATEDEKIKFNYFVDTVKTLEFDYDIVSFEDLLYCSKLEKIICGKNRYLDLANHSSNKTREVSVLGNETRSLQVLDMLNTLNGLEVELYNDHYFTQSRSYIASMGNPVLPNLEYLSEEVIDTITNSVPEIAGEDSGLRYLCDNNSNTIWEPEREETVRTHEIIISLKEPQKISGVKVQQRAYSVYSSSQTAFLADKIVIEVSTDKVTWSPMSHLSTNIIGRGRLEVTLIPMAVPREIQYIKATVTDYTGYGSYCNVSLAELLPYK